MFPSACWNIRAEIRSIDRRGREASMPTERFYRLPEAKKQTIRKAAIKEFSRVPFDKASINQIIHNADISRGSFYTYFEDKADVVEFIFEDSCNQMRDVCQQALSDNGGDYFAMILRIFNFLVEKLQETTDMLNMVRNVFSYQENVKLLGFNGFQDILPNGPEAEEDSVRWVFDQVDKSKYRSQDIRDFKALLSLGMIALLFSVKQFYEHPEQVDVVRDTLHRSLELLRNGACKE